MFHEWIHLAQACEHNLPKITSKAHRGIMEAE